MIKVVSPLDLNCKLYLQYPNQVLSSTMAFALETMHIPGISDIVRKHMLYFLNQMKLAEAFSKFLHQRHIGRTKVAEHTVFASRQQIGFNPFHKTFVFKTMARHVKKKFRKENTINM